MTNEYDDIINLPHPVSKRHPQMSMRDRAAQFAPFAALTGHDAAIQESARETDSFTHLEDSDSRDLDRKMRFLFSQMDSNPIVTITYFQPDNKKEGGSYQTITDYISKFHEYEQEVQFSKGKRIPLISIIDIKGDLFETMEDGEEKNYC